jgi:hypothetical protein
VLRTLADRGHDIWLAAQPGRRPWPPSVVALAEQYPAIRLTQLPDVTFDPWWELASRFRLARFFLRFLRPEYESSPELRARARSRAPQLAVALEGRLSRRPALRNLAARSLDVLDQSTRTAPRFHDYLRDVEPDVVVLSPLVVLKTSQIDLARAAGELGLRTVFAVASWDHLSSKSELTVKPQQVFVWNDAQKREALRWHGVSDDQVVVTGAQVFDEWFATRPSTTRAEFCARLGFAEDRPLVLYVCSSLLEGSEPEPRFVADWAEELRRHPSLRTCNILVRPHFRRVRDWKDVDLASVGPIACWPREEDAPSDAAAKASYFDSLYHADAVVGINTSAMIEAAIVGRPVHTVLLPEFAPNQTGTLHFHFLIDEHDGLLHTASSLEAHAEQLAATLERRDEGPDRSARFVRAFVRPHDDTRATDRFVQALEQLAAQPSPAATGVPWWTHLLRPLLWPFARRAANRARLAHDERRRLKAEQLAAHRRRKASRRTGAAAGE